MRELITRAQADTVFTALLVLGVLAAPIAWGVAKWRRTDTVAAALAAGGIPVLVGLLWRVYNAIADRLGVDTVANLFANLALFVAVGAASGFLWVRVVSRTGQAVAAGAEGEPFQEGETKL